MKSLFIIGVLLISIGIGLEYFGSKPLTSLSKRGQITSSLSIIVGILLIGVSSLMYMKKSN